MINCMACTQLMTAVAQAILNLTVVDDFGKLSRKAEEGHDGYKETNDRLTAMNGEE